MAFQPITNLDSGLVVGFESLARFAGEPRRSPDKWFQDASLAGLRLELELAAAVAAVRSLEELPEHAYMTINASPELAMSDAFIALVGTAGRRIVVEITEHAPIQDYGALNAAINRMRALGVRIAIDDAGAGFANMTHLLQINADLIKLDVELTRHIDIDARRRALVASFVAFARSIGATLVAEGIETEAELRALRGLGVHAGQGYHLGRPAALPDAMATPRRHSFVRAALTTLQDAASFAWSRNRGRHTRASIRALAVLTGALVVIPASFAIAEDSVPGSPAYWVKRRVEDVRLLVALDRETDIRLHMQFARRRLSELNRVLTSGRDEAAAGLMADFRGHVETVERWLPLIASTSGETARWVDDELTNYVDSLAHEVARACARPGRPGCAPIERAARKSKAVLEQLTKARPRPAKPTVPQPVPPPAKGGEGRHNGNSKPADTQNGPADPAANKLSGR